MHVSRQVKHTYYIDGDGRGSSVIRDVSYRYGLFYFFSCKPRDTHTYRTCTNTLIHLTGSVTDVRTQVIAVGNC